MFIQKLSIIIPAYNEAGTMLTVLETISKLELVHNIEKEIIVVNDSSTDTTGEIVKQFIDENKDFQITYLSQIVNEGKGAAIRTGIRHATGDFIIPQDADLELDPNDINKLLNKAVEMKRDVVFGSRFLNKDNPNKNASYYANRFLTSLSNLLNKTNLTDMETCYKLIRSTHAKKLDLRENRFGFEPEITAKLAKIEGITIEEVPINYISRTYEEGKKIGWKDGFKAIWCIFKYSLT